MAQRKTLNIKLTYTQFDTLKYGIKNGAEVTLNLSADLIESSHDESNFPHK